MATAFVMDCSKSSESTLTSTDMLLSLPPTEVASMPSGRQESEKDQDRRRKKAYKWYKHYAKPSRASMRSIVDYYADDIDITRHDVDILPWNLEETKVMKESLKSIQEAIKSTKKKEKEEKQEKKKDKKEKERDGREDTAFAKSNGYNKRPTLLKGQMGDSLRILDLYGSRGSLDVSSSSLDASSSSLDASSSCWNLDHTSLDINTSSSSLDDSSSSWYQKYTSLDFNGSSGTLDASSSSRTQDDRERAAHLLTMKVVDEHKRRREANRRKREVTKKKVDKTSRDMDHRRERAFIWYARMDTPTRAEFKRRVALMADVINCEITPEDIDSLPWNLTGTVVNIATMNALIRDSILKH